MCALRAGPGPVFSFGAIAALSVLSGCSSASSTAYSTPDVQVRSRVAQSVQPAMEDDGLPAQSPPPARIHASPDNPAEPFSKNYGGENPAMLGVGASGPKTNHTPGGDAPAKRPTLPADLPAGFRQKLAAALDTEG